MIFTDVTLFNSPSGGELKEAGSFSQAVDHASPLKAKKRTFPTPCWILPAACQGFTTKREASSAKIVSHRATYPAALTNELATRKLRKLELPANL